MYTPRNSNLLKTTYLISQRKSDDVAAARLYWSSNYGIFSTDYSKATEYVTFEEANLLLGEGQSVVIREYYETKEKKLPFIAQYQLTLKYSERGYYWYRSSIRMPKTGKLTSGYMKTSGKWNSTKKDTKYLTMKLFSTPEEAITFFSNLHLMDNSLERDISQPQT
jgi:hypothetical protein